ncbi:MAG: hypothetical protein LC800_17125 [Acidobacteria bacterium]|nr:hypothetical protein [Acidobacteriota bacterium]
MADDKQPQTNESKRMGAAAGAQSAPVTQNATEEQAIRQQRGGPQEDQLSGATERGAHNNEMRGANPQGNKPDRNQRARQKGDTF